MIDTSSPALPNNPLANATATVQTHLALKAGAVVSPQQYQEVSHNHYLQFYTNILIGTQSLIHRAIQLWASLSDAYSGHVGTLPPEYVASTALVESVLQEVQVAYIHTLYDLFWVVIQ
jgi:hypothetical protein